MNVERWTLSVERWTSPMPAHPELSHAPHSRRLNSPWIWGAGSGTLQGMSQAIMDPAEVRRFAEDLKRFNEDIRDRMALMQGRFAALGDTWQDQEHLRFAEEFQRALKALAKFMESLDGNSGTTILPE